MKPTADDWRRQGQEEYLLGAVFIARTYVPPRPDWDHDHCEFCYVTLSTHEGDLREGYATEDAYRWVCATCFADFREEFGWIER